MTTCLHTYSRVCVLTYSYLFTMVEILTPLRQTCVLELHKDPSAFGSGIGHFALVPVNRVVKVKTHI